MASKSGAVWAIDIGNNSLKALRLSDSHGTVEVVAFDNIQHGKILTGGGISDTEKDELIALSLRQFVSRNEIGKDDIIIISVPSQNSFARFVSLPPVEKKRIPEIIKFEATQQIPFDINDVQWDWQLIDESGGAKAMKVGLFAVKNEVVDSALEHFSRENLQASYVQMSPMALYNYMQYDRPDLVKSDSEAVVALNIGAENTDLVVCTKSTVWQRCIPMGGNSFTRAIAETFKLSFEKAEKLKRTAAMSKYARQILQAMKPVFTDMAAEIQRSLGFYGSSNPNVKLTKILAMGGGTKMRGLLSYLQQTLGITIEVPDSFKNLAISSEVSAAKFHENVCDFDVVYGLAIQPLGLGKIECNLLPRSVMRSMAWAGKAVYFSAAAFMLLIVAILGFVRTNLDKASYSRNEDVRKKITGIINTAEQTISKVEAEKSKIPEYEAKMQKAIEIFKYRGVIPQLNETLLMLLPNEKNNPAQANLYKAFRENDVESILKIPRKERKQIFITSMSVYFSEDVNSATFVDTYLESGRTRGRPESTDVMDDMMMPGMSVPGGAPIYAQSTYGAPALPLRQVSWELLDL